MRIAIIRSACSAVTKSQYNIQEIGLAKELVKLGMDVDIFLISDKNHTYSEKCGQENRVTVYWLNGIKIPGQQGYYPELIDILNSNKYDMIQALDDSQLTTVLVSNYCRKHKIKFVLWQGMYENYPEKYKRMIQYVFDWTLLKVLRNNTKHCIAKTTSARKYLKSKKFPEAVVIPVAMETASFQEQPKINYREKLGIPKSYKILLYVGKVEERRMPLFCMNLYKVVKDKHEDCCLVYVGKGPMVEQTKQYAKEKELKDVYFINQIPQGELPSLYEESSLFILPTRYEIFGMVLIEAMYFGTPVITYRAAGPVDVIENGVDSIVMDSFKVYDWAEKIEEFVFEADMCSKMGSRSSNKIRSSYLWPIVAHDYYDEYCRIISE